MSLTEVPGIYTISKVSLVLRQLDVRERGNEVQGQTRSEEGRKWCPESWKQDVHVCPMGSDQPGASGCCTYLLSDHVSKLPSLC